MAFMARKEVEYKILEWRISPYPLYHSLWVALSSKHARAARGLMGKKEKPIENETLFIQVEKSELNARIKCGGNWQSSHTWVVCWGVI